MPQFKGTEDPYKTHSQRHSQSTYGLNSGLQRAASDLGSSAFGDETPSSTAAASTDLRQRRWLALHPTNALAHHHSQAWHDAETSPQWACQPKKQTQPLGAVTARQDPGEQGRDQGTSLPGQRPVRNSREQKCGRAERVDRGATE